VGEHLHIKLNLQEQEAPRVSGLSKGMSFVKESKVERGVASNARPFSMGARSSLAGSIPSIADRFHQRRGSDVGVMTKRFPHLGSLPPTVVKDASREFPMTRHSVSEVRISSKSSDIIESETSPATLPPSSHTKVDLEYLRRTSVSSDIDLGGIKEMDERDSGSFPLISDDGRSIDDGILSQIEVDGVRLSEVSSKALKLLGVDHEGDDVPPPENILQDKDPTLKLKALSEVGQVSLPLRQVSESLVSMYKRQEHVLRKIQGTRGVGWKRRVASNHIAAHPLPSTS